MVTQTNKGKKRKQKLIDFSNTAVNIIAILGILVILNLLNIRYHRRLDLTLLKLFTLSPQTKKVLNELEKEITVTCFFPKRDARKKVVEGILTEYQYLSPKIKVEFVDPDIEVQKATTYRIKEYGTLVFECGTKRKDLTTWGEQEITSAILKVMREEEKKKKIYFLTGHGEYDYEKTRIDVGASKIKAPLKREYYEVAKLNLLEKKEIPADCSILVIFGPKKELVEEEIKTIKKYVEEGGKLFLLLDPKPGPDLNELVKDWGVKIRDDLVVDKSLHFQRNPIIPAIFHYGFHQITKELREKKIMSMFPVARSLKPTYKGDFTFSKLLETTPQSWGETVVDLTKRPEQGEDEPKGPLIIGAALKKNITKKEEGEEKKFSARVVIIGDADFASDRCLNIWGNLDIFMNAINWLAEEEVLISIRAKDMTVKKVELTDQQQKYIFRSCIFGLPLLIVIWGSIVWWRRR
jgi:ABC-type uncharacterized transport system involved in gliding motility auxiliary subunit